MRPEPRATRASKVTKVRKVTKEILESKESKVFKEKLELQEQLVPPENRVSRV